MSLFVLDTDVLTLYRHGHARICDRVSSCDPSRIAVTAISVEEQLSGWYALLRRCKRTEDLVPVYRRLTETVQFLSRVQVLSFTESAARKHDELRALRLKVRKMDLRLSAIVLVHEATLVTRNLADFGRIPGLVCEDWSV